jgi:hypothetical protein
MRILLAVLVLLVGATEARAQKWIGAGGTSCADFLAWERKSREVKQGMQLWVLGYLSGLNMATYAAKRMDVIAGLTTPQVDMFLDRYCAVNPSHTLNDAANDLWFTLAGRR